MENPVEVLITLPFTDELIDPLRKVSNRLRITVSRATKAEEIPPEYWARTEILYTNTVLPALDLAPRLRWVQFHWAGIDSINIEPLVRKPEISITTLSGVTATPIAEYAVMMLLSLGHRMPELVINQRKAEWPKDRWERFSPLELRDSTVGIVGYGSIGRQIARLLKEFGATVLATKRDVMHPEDNGYVFEGQGDPEGNFIHRLYPPQALRSMLKDCDFVVVTAPLTSETRNMIGIEELSSMQSHAFFINISRGGIVDQKALLEVLKDKRIAGAALDVFSDEPLSPDHPLWKLPNVIITPHISGDTPHYDQKAMLLFAENLQRYLAGQPLFNRYDPQRGY